MDHLRFKSEQTAAAYVADGLEPDTRDAFELHMMSCPECVGEVESWRAIKSRLPREAAPARHAAPARDMAPARSKAPAREAGPVSSVCDTAGVTPMPAVSTPSPVAIPTEAGPARGMAAVRWRVAAALAAGVLVGVAGGWYGKSMQGPSVGSDNITFYSLPPLMRGPADCTSVRIDPRVSLIALRVPAAAKEQQLVGVDSEGRDLAPDAYSVRTQADGSWLVRLRADAVREQGIRFEARSADGTVEPRGCIQGGQPG